MNISKIVQNAKCLVLGATVTTLGLSAGAAASEGVQLWEGGPYWAESNLDGSEVLGHPEYGGLYNFDEADTIVKVQLGPEWRVPSKDDFGKLANEEYCTKTWDPDKKGYRFTGKTAGYTDKSIFLPAAGYDFTDGGQYGTYGRYDAGVKGCYWSSTATPAGNRAFSFSFNDSGEVYPGGSDYCYFRMSVRAVRDTPPVTGPSVTVGEVTSAEPWSMITVNYTLAGVDAKFLYKVVFDVTAGGQTASVTNAAAKLTDGAQEPKVIDTAALFGKQVADTKAKVKISLIAIKPKDLGGVQLWKGGPYFAECNVGATVPGDYGGLYTFENDQAKNAAESLGAGWRLPTKDELQGLLDNCTKEWVTRKDSAGADINGYRFTGTTAGYTNKSIFLPAAGGDYYDGFGRVSSGFDGYYWSSSAGNGNSAWNLWIGFVDTYCVTPSVRSYGYSVRAVR